VPGHPSMFRYLSAALGGVLVVTPAVAVQVHVELVPYAGVYIPTQKLVDQFTASSQVSLKQKRQVALGGRLTVWWTRHLGAEATLGYSPSGVSTVGAQPFDSSARVITASARAVMQISPTGGSSPWLRLGVGVGLLSQGGGAYTGSGPGNGTENVCGTDHVAAVVTAGTALKIGRSASALRLDADDYLYSARLRAGGSTCSLQCRNLGQPFLCNVVESTSPVAKFQNDLVLSVGLAIPI